MDDNLKISTEIKIKNQDTKNILDWNYIVKKLQPELDVYLKLPENKKNYYKSVNCIGSGRYGVVFKYELKNGLNIAIKISSNLDKESNYSSCLFESICSIRKKSKYLVRYLDGYVDKQNLRVYIAMNYYEGGSFDKFIISCKFLKEKHVRIFFYQLLQGVNDLNKDNFMHRDIKPKNIFITKKGNLRLGDFGLCGYKKKWRYDNKEYRTVVSRWWRPPEIELKCSYNLSIDIFSIACIIVEIIIKRPLLRSQKDGFDHLTCMIDILGKMTPECIKYFDNEILKHNLYFVNKKRINIWNKIKIFNNSIISGENKIYDILKETGISYELYNILIKCFNYCPIYRPIASEVLKNEYFNKIRHIYVETIDYSSISCKIGHKLNSFLEKNNLEYLNLFYKHDKEIINIIRNIVIDFKYIESVIYLSFYLYKKYVKEIKTLDEDKPNIAVVLTYIVSVYITSDDIETINFKEYFTRKGAIMSKHLFQQFLSDIVSKIKMEGFMFQNPYIELIDTLSKKNKLILYNIIENDKLNLTFMEMIKLSMIIELFGLKISLLITTYI